MKRAVAYDKEVETFITSKQHKEQADAEYKVASDVLLESAKKLAFQHVIMTYKEKKPEYAHYLDTMRDLHHYAGGRYYLTSYVVGDGNNTVTINLNEQYSYMSFYVQIGEVKHYLRKDKFSDMRKKATKDLLTPLGPFVRWMLDERFSWEYNRELCKAEADPFTYCTKE